MLASGLIPCRCLQRIGRPLYLLSISGMRESIKEGMAEPVDGCATELDW